MGEQQTVKMGFLITRVSLRVLAITAVYRSLLPCPIISPPTPASLSLAQTQTEYIRLRPTRPHSQSLSSEPCLCFHSI